VHQCYLHGAVFAVKLFDSTLLTVEEQVSARGDATALRVVVTLRVLLDGTGCRN
jgi:hypothetical protein